MGKRTAEKADDAVPVGKMARTMVAGATATKIGAKRLGLLTKRPFLSRESFAEEQAKHHDEVAEVVFQGLTKLRGGALKMAQLLSLEFGLLPESYRRELSKSHYRVPPLNRGVIRRLMMGEFGKPPEELFTEFEATAFAAASLGQVHRARLRHGDQVAVKVQYPGIGAALKGDMQMIRQFALPFVGTEYLASAITEMELRLAEELDYNLERQRTAWFRESAPMPGIVVPKVYKDYSTGLVLTTELLKGWHLDQWLATGPSQEQRDHAAQLIYDFFARSLFEFHAIHADSNPGNYLFRDDGTVAVIDFGSVKTFAPDLCEHLRTLWCASIRGDQAQVVSTYCAFGLAKGARKRVERATRTSLAAFGEWMSLPFQTDRFDFGEHRDFCDEGAKLFRDVVTLQEMNGFTTETVIFDRNVYGLFRIFSALRARVRMKNAWVH